MKPLALALLAATALSAAPAFAAPTVIDFEAPTSFSSINDFYNGGTDSAGASGPNLGVSFGGDALGLANDPFQQFFSNAPSPLGVLNVVGNDSALNFAAGFNQAISFAYSAAASTLQAVSIWSGLNGTGTLLASIDLDENATVGCTDTPFCHFDTVTTSFTGVAHSISFGNAAFIAAFDNVSINAIPEPMGVLLVAMGLGGLALQRRLRG